MLDRLLNFEDRLIRVESMLLVFFVLLMLGLATYNVFYRNVMVPLQVRMLTQSAEVTQPVASEHAAEVPEAPEVAEDPAAGFGGGFGGDFGDDGAGFGGDFGGDFGEPEEVAPDLPQEDGAGFAGGFGGDFGEDDGAGGFGGGFDAPAEPASTSAEVAPAPIGEVEMPILALWIDALKVEWIDVLLRQLVLVVGFLGAMLATQRRKHITIDALSKVLPRNILGWVHVFTAALSCAMCVILAVAGSDLVAISLEFPKELMSWADEWHFQLIFPVGFGLLALHFAIRVVEAAMYASGRAEPPADYDLGGAA